MNRRVLLIDDSQEVLRSMRRQLAREYELATAQSGPEGLELLASAEPFAVVVSDYHMPIMDGVEFLRRARELAPHSTRLVLTGDGGAEVAKKVLNESQAFRLLTKPCSKEDLCAAIDDALEAYEARIAEVELAEQLERTKSNLEDLNTDLEDRISLQMDTLHVLHQFAVRLNGAESLQEIASMASAAAFDALHGHAVHVQLWDDDASRGSVESDSGPEMSARMHREALTTSEGQVGEVVVDVVGAPVPSAHVRLRGGRAGHAVPCHDDLGGPVRAQPG